MHSFAQHAREASTSTRTAWWKWKRGNGVGRAAWPRYATACLMLLATWAPQAAEAQTPLEQCRQRESSCRQELEALPKEVAGLRNCQAELNACKEKLSRRFLAIVIQWDTDRHDVDLHVIDAAGKEFYFRHKTAPGRSGELSVDTTRGPGVEVWEITEAPAGKYQVYYNLFDRQGNNADAVVKGGVYHRDGHHRFRVRRLRQQGRRFAELVAVVTVWELTGGSRSRSSSGESLSESGHLRGFA